MLIGDTSMLTKASQGRFADLPALVFVFFISVPIYPQTVSAQENLIVVLLKVEDE